MNYYYDLELNFLEESYKFYEWEKDDIWEYYKKVPLFLVSNKCLKDILEYEIIVDKEFLDKIYNKAKRRDGVSKYVALFAASDGVIGVEFGDDGKSILWSYVSVMDEVNIMDILDTLKQEKIKYEIGNVRIRKDNLRMEDIIRNFVLKEIDSLENNVNIYKLKYLYIEWFNEEGNNKLDMIQKMKDKINGDIGNDEVKVYNLIKLSYSKV